MRKRGSRERLHERGDRRPVRFAIRLHECTRSVAAGRGRYEGRHELRIDRGDDRCPGGAFGSRRGHEHRHRELLRVVGDPGLRLALIGEVLAGREREHGVGAEVALPTPFTASPARASTAIALKPSLLRCGAIARYSPRPARTGACPRPTGESSLSSVIGSSRTRTPFVFSPAHIGPEYFPGDRRGRRPRRSARLLACARRRDEVRADARVRSLTAGFSCWGDVHGATSSNPGK